MAEVAGEIVILRDEELLRKLALLIYRQEVEAIKNINFRSEYERRDYLLNCGSGYKTTLNILDVADDAKKKEEDGGDETKASIASDYHSYIISGINFGLQTVRNYNLRLDYLNKIKDHSDAIIKALAELDTNVVSEVEQMVKATRQYKDAMNNLLYKHKSATFKYYSKLLKIEGTTFEKLVARYMAELKLSGHFKDLKEEEKIQVYNRIIEASGHGGVITGVLSEVTLVAGAAVLIFSLGSMVWDIFTSERPIETVTRDAVTAISMVAGASVTELLDAAASTLVGEEVEGSVAFLAVTGIINSFIGDFIVTAVAALLIGIIFSTGSSTTLTTDGYYCYVAKLPDGVAIARILARQEGLTTQLTLADEASKATKLAGEASAAE